MKRIVLGAVFAGAVAASPAGAVTYDTLASFAYVNFSQGLGQCQLAEPSCEAVPADRTGLDKAFDKTGSNPNLGTFHSLGAFGFATFGVAPGMAIRGAMTLETTFGNDGGETWPEALAIVLHNDVNESVDWTAALMGALPLASLNGPLPLATVTAFAGGLFDEASDVTSSGLYGLLNTQVLNGSGAFAGYVTNDGNTPDTNDIITAAGVSITRSNAGQNGWQFDIEISEAFGDYRYITLLDMTMSDMPTFWQSRRGDGWDLAHLSVEAEVPEPAAAALFALGLLAAGGLRRRR